MTHSYDRTVIIGLTGRAGSGKDTAAAYLAARYGFHRAAFADALRETVAAFLRAGGITDMGWMHDPARKNTPIPGIGYSARHLMQTLGTEWARNCLDPWTWVRILEQRLGMTVDAERPVAPRIVVTDARFPNEARWLGLHCAPIIRLHRNSARYMPSVSCRCGHSRMAGPSLQSGTSGSSSPASSWITSSRRPITSATTRSVSARCAEQVT